MARRYRYYVFPVSNVTEGVLAPSGSHQPGWATPEEAHADAKAFFGSSPYMVVRSVGYTWGVEPKTKTPPAPDTSTDVSDGEEENP